MIYKNYLILSHFNPYQLSRLINRLNDEYSFFYLHIDKKTEIAPFKSVINSHNIMFIKERIGCIWGDFSIVKATLNLIYNVIKNQHHHFTILLSGQDYPIKKTETLNYFLKENCVYNFIDISPAVALWETYKDRTEKYRFNHSAQKGDFSICKSLPLATSVEKSNAFKYLKNGKISIAQYLQLLEKRVPIFKNQYGGSQWWAFNYDTLEAVYSFIVNNYKDLIDYYRYTHCADELFFQTILFHLAQKKKSIKIKPSLTYVNWNRTNCALPVTFNKDDISELIHQPYNKLFARKFDAAYCSEILDKIDKYAT